MNKQKMGIFFKVDEFIPLCEKVPAEDSVLAECRMLSANKKSLTEVCKHFLIQSLRRFVPLDCQRISISLIGNYNDFKSNLLLQRYVLS